ncbi:site-2 protease family protein [Kitasatospora sp. NPDC002227]|uniref:site-2 protease family protein n=1 Tax=Kitasatospora sp. NPDC002227 TaxID=3154773 RepID=UPI003325C6ED
MTYADTQGSRREENRISPVFWVLLATLGTSGWAVWSGFGTASFGVFLFVVSGWMVSLCLHEYAHARTALHGGDITVGAKGYLTLNPLKYANGLLSFVLPVIFIIIGGIGLPGGAVYLETHRVQGRLKHSLISAAGPVVNLLFAVALLVPVGAGWLGGPEGAGWLSYDQVPPVAAAFAMLGFLQLSAAVINLLPVPGLDGYGIVEPWLSLKTRRTLAPFAPYGMLAVFVVLWQSSLSSKFFDLLYWLALRLGVHDVYVTHGFQLFRFWEN